MTLGIVMAMFAGVNVVVLGVGGALVNYLVRIERRLTKIETKMGIDEND